jgi:hypothetical protein
VHDYFASADQFTKESEKEEQVVEEGFMNEASKY